MDSVKEKRTVTQLNAIIDRCDREILKERRITEDIMSKHRKEVAERVDS